MRGSSRAFYAGDRRRWFASVPAFGYHSPGAHRERAGAERGARARDRGRRRLGPARRARGRALAPPARRATSARADGFRAHGAQRASAGRDPPVAYRRPLPRGSGAPAARPGAAERVRLPFPPRLTLGPPPLGPPPASPQPSSSPDANSSYSSASIRSSSSASSLSLISTSHPSWYGSSLTIAGWSSSSVLMA